MNNLLRGEYQDEKVQPCHREKTVQSDGRGITSAPELGKPDYELALKEHDAYIEALKQCDVRDRRRGEEVLL